MSCGVCLPYFSSDVYLDEEVDKVGVVIELRTQCT